MIRIARNQRKGDRGLGKDHLLIGQIDLAPRTGFLQCRSAQRAIAYIGYRYLDRILVHRRFHAQDVRSYDDVLRKILRYAAAHHQQTRGGHLQLKLGQLIKVLGRIERDHRLALPFVLMRDKAEARGAVRKGRHKDRHILLVAGKHDRVVVAALRRTAVLLQIRTHLADDLARAVRARLHAVDDLVHGFVADAQLFFVDEGVVDPVDHQLAQFVIAGTILVEVRGDIMTEAQRLKEVLIDDVRAGRDDRVHHVVADELDNNLLHAGGDQGTSQAKDHAALGVAQHHVIQLCRARQVARAERQVGHRVHQGHDVQLRDIDRLDLCCKKFLLGGHECSPVCVLHVRLLETESSSKPGSQEQRKPAAPVYLPNPRPIPRSHSHRPRCLFV